MKQALELAMVLALEPSVLLLDEPTAGLTKPERTLIGQILVDLARNHQLCILLVEHDLDFVREISSRVIVLHQGKHRAGRHASPRWSSRSWCARSTPAATTERRRGRRMSAAVALGRRG